MNTNFNDAFQPSQLEVNLDDDDPVKGGITKEKEPEERFPNDPGSANDIT